MGWGYWFGGVSGWGLEREKGEEGRERREGREERREEGREDIV